MSGKKDKQRFKYKNVESIDSVFNYVATINKGLKSRRIGFGDDDDMIEMSLPDDVELSIEAETRKGKGELKISLAWKTPEPAVIAPEQNGKKKDKKGRKEDGKASKKDKKKNKDKQPAKLKSASKDEKRTVEATKAPPADVPGAVADEAERKAVKRAARNEASKKRVIRKQPARKSTAKKQPSASRSKSPAKRTPPGKKT